MTRDDLDPAVTAILSDHWGDRRAWFEFTLGSAACHSIVADLDLDRVLEIRIDVHRREGGLAARVGVEW